MRKTLAKEAQDSSQVPTFYDEYFASGDAPTRTKKGSKGRVVASEAGRQLSTIFITINNVIVGKEVKDKKEKQTEEKSRAKQTSQQTKRNTSHRHRRRRHTKKGQPVVSDILHGILHKLQREEGE